MDLYIPRCTKGICERSYSIRVCTPISYPILMVLFYQFCLQLVRYIHIRNLPQSYHDIVVFYI